MPIINLLDNSLGMLDLHPFAFIIVYHPSGSVCTCTNSSGNRTISPTRKIFYIRSNTTPFKCIIKCSDGTLSVSGTINVTEEGQSISTAISYNLPIGYRLIEYIEATGTLCIDSGLNNGMISTTLFESLCEMYYTSISGTNTIWGTTSGNEHDLVLTSSGITMRTYASSSNTITNSNITAGLWNTIMTSLITGAQSLNVNGTIVTGNKTVSRSAGANRYIFANNVGTSRNNYMRGRIRTLKFWNNNILVRDFIPCIRMSDNEIGMWDNLSNIFYTNAGTGVFIAGDYV